MRHPANHIFQHTPDTLEEWCARHGMKPFRAAQVLEWVYQKRVADPARMTNLSALDRATLAREMAFLSGEVVAHQAATDGTRKLLIEWDEGTRSPEPSTSPEPTRPEPSVPTPGAPTDGAMAEAPGIRTQDVRTAGLQDAPRDVPTGLASRLRVLGQPILGVVERPGGNTARQTECVMIPSEPSPNSESSTPPRPRRTACISSQVGCPVGCAFCASGLGGLEGNLSAGRIVEQVWRLGAMLKDDEEAAGPAKPTPVARIGRITNVVFMGMGEPLSNFASVVHAVRTIAADWGLGISARKITISTVGLPKAIERLAAELELPVTLALSLHAPNDELRRRLIPWAEYTTIKDLLAACRKWFEKTGREITLEYTLLRGVNDRPEHAAELAQVAGTLRANVNLIRYNEVMGLEFKRPRTEDVLEFQRLLRLKGVNAHIRRSRGRDIAAACGQLRHERASA